MQTKITSVTEAPGEVGLDLSLWKSPYLPLVPRGARLVVLRAGLSISNMEEILGLDHTIFNGPTLGFYFGVQGACEVNPNKMTSVVEKMETVVENGIPGTMIFRHRCGCLVGATF